MKYESTPSDLEFWGDPDLFKLIAKASTISEGWVKTTKGMQVGPNVVLQVTTQQRNPNGAYAITEALSLVPNAEIVDKLNEEGEVVARYIEYIKF